MKPVGGEEGIEAMTIGGLSFWSQNNLCCKKNVGSGLRKFIAYLESALSSVKFPIFV